MRWSGARYVRWGTDLWDSETPSNQEGKVKHWNRCPSEVFDTPYLRLFWKEVNAFTMPFNFWSIPGTHSIELCVFYSVWYCIVQSFLWYCNVCCLHLSSILYCATCWMCCIVLFISHYMVRTAVNVTCGCFVMCCFGIFFPRCILFCLLYWTYCIFMCYIFHCAFYSFPL